MQLAWRSVGPREPNHELIWLTVSIVSIALAAVWLTLGLPWPICLFHSITGHPCLTCGATRAAIASFHAEFLTAVRWNPLVFLVYCGIAVFDLYALTVLITRSRRLRAYLSKGEKRIFRGAAIVLLLVNWVYLLTHSSMFNG